ncbi:dihydrofolate reductase [Marinicella meishanensis]|uniref:dihydrofolate reductase n=1 Tax=Marinicella meishanensis TaxID=2873263 RepID=UPI001CC087F5|nr:dihydrofolate reductase [Marinicella sp. NBU2979]
MKITLIAAMDRQQLIGKDNQLPWHLPADLQFFKQQTMGKTLLMGRKTCESLPFALPGRENWVLSRNPSFHRKGFTTITDLNALPEVDELMVIGGAKIYQLMLPQATHMIITRIQAELSGDTHFPEVNWAAWQVDRLTNHPPAVDHPDWAFDFVFYRRVND